MAAICSHKDGDRNHVSFTAHLIALFRSKESVRDDRLFFDPYAAILAGTSAETWYETDNAKDASIINLMQAHISCRTIAIDKIIEMSLRENNIEQICVLGAGLDSRPWRLKTNIFNEKPAHEIFYFEVDFPEIFQYKLPIIETLNGVSEFKYVPVHADLSLPNWSDHLIAAGFDQTKRTLWLAEGLTMYLTEVEANLFFGMISNLSTKDSRLVADFISEATLSGLNNPFSSMFRFTPVDPLQLTTSHGWAGTAESILTYCIKYNRKVDESRKQSCENYFITSHTFL